jgi:cytochrome c556
MTESPKKLMPMHRLCDKLADARALVRTVELALGSIHQDSTPQDAEDVRMVAHMLTKRLRKIERHFLAHHQAGLRRAFPERFPNG